MSNVALLERRQNNKKRKRTPNTTQGDNSIGIIMHFHRHNKVEAEEDSAKKIASFTKISKQCTWYSPILKRLRVMIQFLISL